MRTSLVRGVYLGLIFAGFLACRPDPTGRPCKTDDQCGPGFDCFRDVCFPVCTSDADCHNGRSCFRYHCVVPGEERGGTTMAPPPGREVPPAPDPTIAELRAIRRELELLRHDLAHLLGGAHEHGTPPDVGHTHPGPGLSGATTGPRPPTTIRLPPTTPTPPPPSDPPKGPGR